MKHITIEKNISYCTSCPHCEFYGMNTSGEMYRCRLTGRDLISVIPHGVPTIIVIPDECPLEEVR